jgi:Uma2 family endonuclease
MSVSEPSDKESVWQVPSRLRLELLAALSADPARPATMTYAEFLAWTDEDTLAEWADGRLIMASPASAQHQYLALFIAGVLSTYVALHDLGTVLTAPFQMKLARSGREPDVLFVAKEHLARLQATLLQGAADLVVEIVSDESVARDRGTKFEEYREAGIPEYWLIDPRVEQAEFYQLDERGRYQLIPAGVDGVYRSRSVPGLWMRVDWLWQQPLPSPTEALLAIDREVYGAYLEEQLRQASGAHAQMEGQQ